MPNPILSAALQSGLIVIVADAASDYREYQWFATPEIG